MKFGDFEPVLAYTQGATEHNEFHFKNGYGASVIRGPFSYGGWDRLFELAVLKKHKKDWEVTYETPITDDVLGWLTADDVAILLKKISTLKR
ncbi:hypothetical protein ACE418_01215 [Megasphaera sp. WILCCON 0056]|uniref:hypothetical protein n=1 Tax=Megasphaera sp. WILCCON 0056 TaxID=3345340 RepID=UPI003A80A634